MKKKDTLKTYKIFSEFFTTEKERLVFLRMSKACMIYGILIGFLVGIGVWIVNILNTNIEYQPYLYPIIKLSISVIKSWIYRKSHLVSYGVSNINHITYNAHDDVELTVILLGVLIVVCGIGIWYVPTTFLTPFALLVSVYSVKKMKGKKRYSKNDGSGDSNVWWKWHGPNIINKVWPKIKIIPFFKERTIFVVRIPLMFKKIKKNIKHYFIKNNLEKKDIFFVFIIASLMYLSLEITCSTFQILVI